MEVYFEWVGWVDIFFRVHGNEWRRVEVYFGWVEVGGHLW